MTIELTPEYIYASITTLLLVLQVWQYYKLTKVEKEIAQIWIQISILVASISSKLLDLDKKIDDRVGKQDKA